MTKPVIAEFSSVTSLMAFKQSKQLTNCVIIENMLYCTLPENYIDDLPAYGGRIISEGIMSPKDLGEPVER